MKRQIRQKVSTNSLLSGNIHGLLFLVFFLTTFFFTFLNRKLYIFYKIHHVYLIFIYHIDNFLFRGFQYIYIYI